MNRIRILLADDHPMVLEGVAKILEENEFDVVGKVEDGRALVAAAQQLTPDVIVTDMTMPLLHGLEACRQLKRLVGSKVIFLTMHADVAYAKEAFQAGASGYLLKRNAASELIDAIHTVIQGQTYLTPMVFLDDQMPIEYASHKEVPILKHLTPRQREVLQLIAEGKSIKEIAAILCLSVKTVEFHRTKLMENLHMQSNADLTKFALSHGLVEQAAFPMASSR
jgi:DNA-binding NarL/FixJ family response regulator